MKRRLSFFIFGALLLMLFVGAKTTPVAASTNENMSGYAWSSTIGWIKLNNCTDPAVNSTCSGTDYGVNVALTAPGAMSGYAWSSNIGWISFNGSDVGNSCIPSINDSCQAFADWANPDGSGKVTIKGWARACSVFQAGCNGALKSDTKRGGWDGYIALSTMPGDVPWGGWVINADKTVSGYAWGSDVVGWVKSINLSISDIGSGSILSLTATPPVILSGETSTLQVTATNLTGANACTGSWGPLTMSETAGVWRSSSVVSPTSTTTYSVNCTVTRGGSSSTTATVTVLKINYFNNYACAASSGTTPEQTWETEGAATCNISKGASVDNGVGLNSLGGVLKPDGHYYKASSILASPLPATYTLQCSNGGKTVTQTTIVSQCSADFILSATPTIQRFKDGTGAYSGLKTATFDITINPQGGFNSAVTLSETHNTIIAMPASSIFTFTPNPLTYNGSVYTIGRLTVSIDPADLKKEIYTPIRVTGTGGGKTHSVNVTIDAVKTIIENEL